MANALRAARQGDNVATQYTTTAIEKIVMHALVAKGYTPPEATVIIAKLRETTAKFAGDALIELSSDGQHVAIAGCTCMHKSNAAKGQGAVLISCSGKEFWIPVTQLSPLTEVAAVGDVGILVVKRWIAEQKKFIVNGKAAITLPS